MFERSPGQGVTCHVGVNGELEQPIRCDWTAAAFFHLLVAVEYVKVGAQGAFCGAIVDEP
jgi:hypothetical protein